MPHYRTYIVPLYISGLLIIGLSLSACSDYVNSLVDSFSKKTDTTQQVVPLTLAVASRIAWMPWFLAAEENVFKEHTQKYKVDVQFISGEYQEILDKFVKGEVHAIAITNIEAIGQLVKQGVESDVILIMNYSNGNESILLPAKADTNVLKLRGKTFALVSNSESHYLLDRYLVRNQIPFDDVPIQDTSEAEVPNMFLDKSIYGVVTSHPNSDKLIHDHRAKVLFDSRAIPKEILDLIIVDRKTLADHPTFAQALLSGWFSIMERLQGNRRGGTLDAMARLAGVSREDYDNLMSSISLNDTPTKALSAIRDRQLTKMMRHIRYFMERHTLTGDEPFSGWVSYPGRTPGLLHFNGQPLQEFVAPLK